MHDELNSMEISKKMLELTTLPFSPMNPSLPMKRKFNSSSHFRPHLTSASSDMSSEEHQMEMDECEDEYDDSRLLGRQNGTLVGNGKLVGGLKSSKSITGTVNIPSPPSSTRSSFDGLTRDSLLSNGDLGAESNSSEPDSSSEHVSISGSIAFDQSNDLFDEQPECQSELSSAGVASPLNHEPAIDDEILLLTTDLVEKVCITTEEEAQWAEVKIDFNGETVLPSGLRIVQGVADMPICRDSEEEAVLPPRFTNQLNFLKHILQKYICRYKTATPFLQPVDSVRYKIPHYYLIIRKPMDLNTIKNRLNFLWYRSAQECIDDIRQIFANCFLFNAPTEFVYTSGKKLEEYFNEKLKDMPEPETEMPCPPRPNYEEYIKNLKKNNSKRRNTSISDLETNSPRTPISPGTLTFTPIKMTTRRERGVMVRKPSKDLPAPIATPVNKPSSGRKVPLNDAMRFVLNFVKELFSKKHQSYAWPFYQPVNTEVYKDYLQFVKKPIDLSTIKINIETGKYITVNDFAKDMRLMISNCLRYNKPGSEIIEQARSLREVFEHFYANIPEEHLNTKLSLPTKPGNSLARQSSASNTTGFAPQNTPHGSKLHNAGSESHYRNTSKGPKVKSPVKPRAQMDESGQLFSSFGINGISADMNNDQRMKFLENQVVSLTQALTSIVTGAGAFNPQFLVRSIGANAGVNNAPVKNGGGGRGRGRKANGDAPKRQYTKRANNKRKRHLSSEEEDSEDEGQGGSLLSTINEPLAGPFDPHDINDLKQLKHDLEELSAADLQNVLRILQRSEPTLSCDDEQNVEIDFEKLQPKTLVALRKYVSSCQRNGAKKTSANGRPPAAIRNSSTNKRQCHQSNSRSHLDTDCDTPTTSNHWSRAGSRASNLQLSESSSDSEVD